MLSVNSVSAQSETDTATVFPVGERLTYTVSLDKLPDVAYAETYVVSTGRLGDADAVELRLRIKTRELASAAFYMVDESRTTFAAMQSGVPLAIRRTGLINGLPGETAVDLSNSQSAGFDLATLIYAIRRGGTVGSAVLDEDGRSHSVSYQIKGTEKITTPAGVYEASVMVVQSSYLTELGISEFTMALANDTGRTPVRYTLKTEKGKFIAHLSSVQIVLPEPVATPTPIATPSPTPTPTPTPVATPTPYINDQPLPKDLAFPLGEKLTYGISSQGRNVGRVTLWAKERTQFQGRDSLLLTAEITDAEPGAGFARADSFTVRVDPLTLTPQVSEIKFSGALGWMNQTAVFDPVSNAITVGTERIDAPYGTHTVLSLFYAMRSFNLRPSRVTSSPVNDTRVAVLWANRTSVFSLRPSDAEVTDLAGRRVAAQLIGIVANNPQLDSLSPKVWLSNDDARTPVRIQIGTYQLDLVSRSVEIGSK